MPAAEPAKDRIARQLREALDRLHGEIDRVEFWADALDRLVQPIPEYDPSKTRLNQFSLAPRPDASRRVDALAGHGKDGE